MVIFGAIFLLMTLLILYSSNSGSEIIYGPFHVATNHHSIKTTDLRKWAGKDGYVAVYGNKVGQKALVFFCLSLLLYTKVGC